MTDAHDAEYVGEKTRRGLSWNLIGAASTNVLRIVVIAVLSRTLTAADFGVVAAALSLNVFLYFARDLGVGQALVQRKTVERAHLQSAFSFSLFMGLAISILLSLTAQPLANVYKIPEWPYVIRAMGLLSILRGISNVSRMMCQRAMNFRMLAITDASTFALGSIASMVLAVMGWGPWSLVAGYLVEEAAATICFLIASPPPWSLRVEKVRLQELMSFGGAATVSHLVSVVAVYGDNFVIGNALGARMLGFYARAYDLIRYPSIVFDNIVGSVLFPAFSRIQNDGKRLAAGFRRALFANAIVMLPASSALLVVAPEAITVILGSGWSEAVAPFRILVLTMMMRASAKVGQTVAGAAGHIRSVAAVNTIYMIMVVSGAALVVRWGIDAVAISTAIAITVVFMGSCIVGARASGSSLTSVASAHVPGIALALASGGASWALVAVLRGRGVPPVVVFASTAVVAIAVTGALVLLAISTRWGDFAWLRSEFDRVLNRRSRATPDDRS